jgi:hypothetical protein
VVFAPDLDVNGAAADRTVLDIRLAFFAGIHHQGDTFATKWTLNLGFNHSLLRWHHNMLDKLAKVLYFAQRTGHLLIRPVMKGSQNG